MKNCNNPNCSNTIPDNKRADAKYCSKKCKNEAFVLNRAQQLNGFSAPAPGVPATPGLVGAQDPASQFIITQLTRDRDRWEKQYEEEKQRRQEAEKRTTELKEEIATVKTDWDMERLENKNPSGLNGFLQAIPEDARSQLFAAAPALLQALMSRAPSPQPQLTGSGTSEAVQNIVRWLNSLSDDHQAAIYTAIMEPLADLHQQEGDLALTNAMKYINTQITQAANAS